MRLGICSFSLHRTVASGKMDFAGFVALSRRVGCTTLDPWCAHLEGGGDGANQLHAGRNPGFPASHGCIRVPTEFAKKLYAATAMGATVEVTDVAYVEGIPAPMSDAEATARANGTADGTLGGVLASR